MLCRPGARRRHGSSNDLRLLAGIGRRTDTGATHETAQYPSKWIRNEQDRLKQVRYSIQHQEEQVTCPNLQSLRRPWLLCLAADNNATVVELTPKPVQDRFASSVVETETNPEPAKSTKTAEAVGPTGAA